jgi:diphosphoinositol-polyphosphate diphosphatase
LLDFIFCATALTVRFSVHKQLLGFYDFKSKTHQDEFCPEGMCRAAVFALHVKEELASWPEQSTRQRSWLTVPEAASQSRYPWVQEALITGFSVWHEKWSKAISGADPSPR